MLLPQPIKPIKNILLDGMFCVELSVMI